MPRQSRIAIFCGKGGVGKTTLALALGLRHSRQASKVVIVSSHSLEELALSVSLAGLAEQYPAAVQNLFVVHLDARKLLAEVVQNNFPVEWVARGVLNSRLYQNLVEVAPGLKEFYFLARLQQLAERKAPASGDDASQYDLLLWDAPATGHFLTTLRSARSFHTYLTGPLASAGEEVNRFFSTPENITLLPVTLAEEMSIEETVELCRALEAEFELRPAAVLVNLASPMFSRPDELARLRQENVEPSGGALRFAIDRAAAEQQRVQSLRERVRAPVVAVPRAVQWSTDLDLLAQLSESLDLPGIGVSAP